MATGLFKPKNSDTTELKNAQDSIKRIDSYMIGIIIVSVFGFITLLATIAGLVIDSYRFKASSYQDLINKINILYENANREEDVKNTEIELLRKQIESLKIKNPYLK